MNDSVTNDEETSAMQKSTFNQTQKIFIDDRVMYLLTTREEDKEVFDCIRALLKDKKIEVIFMRPGNWDLGKVIRRTIQISVKDIASDCGIKDCVITEKVTCLEYGWGGSNGSDARKKAIDNHCQNKSGLSYCIAPSIHPLYGDGDRRYTCYYAENVAQLAKILKGLEVSLCTSPSSLDLPNLTMPLQTSSTSSASVPSASTPPTTPVPLSQGQQTQAPTSTISTLTTSAAVEGTKPASRSPYGSSMLSSSSCVSSSSTREFSSYLSRQAWSNTSTASTSTTSSGGGEAKVEGSVTSPMITMKITEELGNQCLGVSQEFKSSIFGMSEQLRGEAEDIYREIVELRYKLYGEINKISRIKGEHECETDKEFILKVVKAYFIDRLIAIMDVPARYDDFKGIPGKIEEEVKRVKDGIKIRCVVSGKVVSGGWTVFNEPTIQTRGCDVLAGKMSCRTKGVVESIQKIVAKYLKEQGLGTQEEQQISQLR